MYQTIDGTTVLTVNDWLAAGLTKNQFEHDSKQGYLNIFRRGINGNTLFDAKSIKRPDRRTAIESTHGKLEEVKPTNLETPKIDQKARTYFIDFTKPDGSPLEPETIKSYTNKASLFETLKNGLHEQRMEMARIGGGKRVKMGEFYEMALEWYQEWQGDFPCSKITNVRSFERAFKAYLKDGYESIAHGLIGSDNTRKVSAAMENLLLSLWRTNDKPFVHRVYELYCEFVAGKRELFDTETGETFRPQDFCHKGRAIEISEMIEPSLSAISAKTMPITNAATLQIIPVCTNPNNAA